MGSTLYDYTKSAEELRQFELREKCSQIAIEYERFNLENDVYKMFREWLLEQAKTGYSATFTSKDLNKLLNVRNIMQPDPVTIEAKDGDYDSCDKFRMLSSGHYCSYKNGYESNYAWYIIWKITRAYNNKNGCIVINAPRNEDGCVKINLDWSKDAQECITYKKWEEKANIEFDTIGYAIGSGVISSVISFIVFEIFAFFIPDEQLSILRFFVLCLMFALYLVFYSRIKKVKISNLTEETAINFHTHCNMIEETRYSRYSIRLDKQRSWIGNSPGWF